LDIGLDIGYWILDWILDIGYWILDKAKRWGDYSSLMVMVEQRVIRKKIVLYEDK